MNYSILLWILSRQQLNHKQQIPKDLPNVPLAFRTSQELLSDCHLFGHTGTEELDPHLPEHNQREKKIQTTHLSAPCLRTRPLPPVRMRKPELSTRISNQCPIMHHQMALWKVQCRHLHCMLRPTKMSLLESMTICTTKLTIKSGFKFLSNCTWLDKTPVDLLTFCWSFCSPMKSFFVFGLNM